LLDLLEPPVPFNDPNGSATSFVSATMPWFDGLIAAPARPAADLCGSITWLMSCRVISRGRRTCSVFECPFGVPVGWAIERAG